MLHTKNQAGTSLPQAFTFNATDQQIRTAVISGEPFFVAKDVCSILDISNNRDAIIDLDDDEKLMSVIPTPGQKRQVWLVNESGLYHLIFQSRKPEAKMFRKWVTAEVLPALRKTGTYAAPENVAQKLNCFNDYLDMRHILYREVQIKGGMVRVVRLNDVDWYSLNDIHTALRSRTDSCQTARRLLDTGKPLARKIFIFGNTHASWFVTETAMKLVMLSNRTCKKNGGK
ncbi:MAG: Bro-N domain-containing protein [Candidatus Egerieousia sp.]